ncbi:TetR/AcrR family transcriptional regulator [Cumulibacter manganitolerans]|uniref:TetR/AcrR family transcriptional regulator n=1 Tax=Cumulibacter manganitolerans TaxID=1884992 RepID=UPI0012966F6D|nr:TetR/AcrR family transcriptional regulator [Cumulibacter manganitolerans]
MPDSVSATDAGSAPVSSVLAPSVPLPSTARGRRRRDAILDAATEMMFRKGIFHTSLDEVLERGGAGKSQLYHYFGGKQELIRAVIERQLENVLATEPTFDSIRSWHDLESWRDAFLSRHSTESGPLGCRLGKFAGELDGDDTLRPMLVGAFEQWRSHMTAAFTRLRSRGDLQVHADPEVLSKALLAAIQGGLLLGRLQRDPDALEQSMTMAFGYLRSFRAR